MQSMATVVSMRGGAMRPCLAEFGRRSRLFAADAPVAILFALGLQDLLAAVVAARTDVVTQVDLAGGRLDCERGIAQKIVGAVHAALGGRLLVLLDCHVKAPSPYIAARCTQAPCCGTIGSARITSS